MMKKSVLLLAFAASVLAAQPAFAKGPPAGAGGLPPGVKLGPPSAKAADKAADANEKALDKAADADDKAADARSKAADKTADANAKAFHNAANILGKLNAMHASARAFAHANPNSTVGALATYQKNMTSATTDAQVIAARQQLAAATNKTLTSAAISKIDSTLGIKGASPTLGTTG